MQSTRVTIEIFIGGILIFLAMGYAFETVQSGVIKEFITNLYTRVPYLEKSPQILYFAIAAFAYAFGHVFEYLGRELFEWLLDFRKNKFIQTELGLKIKKKAELLYEFDKTTEVWGVMRFAIIQFGNEKLNQEVNSHIDRMRVLRILFLALLIFALSYFFQNFGIMGIAAYIATLIGVTILIWYQASFTFSSQNVGKTDKNIIRRIKSLIKKTWFWLFILISILTIMTIPQLKGETTFISWAVLVINVALYNAISSRFDRYCRAIARGFLVMEKISDNVKK